MMNRQTLVRTALAASLVAILAGCGQMRPSQKMDIYEATLSGAQEVPPVNTAARGTAEIQLNTNTNMLTWKITYTGLSGPATAGHIHGPAGAGSNAAPVVPFANVGSQPVTGQATITPQQFGDLAAGLWYVNIHTAANPGGEIRGQLRRRQ
jgi:hypothetical protein